MADRLVGGRRAGPPEKWAPLCPGCNGPLTREANMHADYGTSRGVVSMPIGWSWKCPRSACIVERLLVDLAAPTER